MRSRELLSTLLSRGKSSSSSSIKRRILRPKRGFIPKDGKSLQDFINKPSSIEYNDEGNGKSFSIQTYGCQMNTSDTEIVRSVLGKAGYSESSTQEEADVLLLNTCAIREKAETKIWTRLNEIRAKNRTKKKDKRQTVAVLGCMAERLKEKLLERADVVAGPDAYRDLPSLIDVVSGGDASAAFNVQLSTEETYGDIRPVRDNHSTVTAFTSIQRGCNNVCSFCIVPHTRGRERSRSLISIRDEVKRLVEDGYREVTLLGQNVNSYFDRIDTNDGNVMIKTTATTTTTSKTADGFTNMYRLRDGAGHRFADLLEAIAEIDPEMRVRFTSPHPKDFSEDVLEVISKYPNIVRGLHLPAQSGSSEMLQRMRRGHSREAYLSLVQNIKNTLGSQTELSTDMIAGFCGETEEEHLDTVRLMEEVGYEQAFMFAYSLRERTHAAHRMNDDVSPEIKSRRLSEIIQTFRKTGQLKSERRDVGSVQLVLVEGESRKSKKSAKQWQGKNDGVKRILFDDETSVFDSLSSYLLKNSLSSSFVGEGQYVAVKVTEPGVSTLRGVPLFISGIQEFSMLRNDLPDPFYMEEGMLYLRE